MSEQQPVGKIPLIVIVGPTAVGKTELAIQTAKALHGEIISADSMQIYKDMNIGTAKPSMEERQGIPHHMMDIIKPGQGYSVAEYQQQAKEEIVQIYQRGKLPILTGGTGLYVQSILYPMNFTDAVEDPDYRLLMQNIADREGNASVHSMLAEKDPETAQRLHKNDLRRVIRALEIHHMTGKPMSSFKQQFNEEDLPYKMVLVGLTMDRAKLYQRINFRVDMMLANGLIDEVKDLLTKGFSKNLVSMQGLGYKEIIRYLEGANNIEDAVDILKRDTRRFAKRQLTWFRRDQHIQWVDVDLFDNQRQLTDWIIIHIKKKLAL